MGKRRHTPTEYEQALKIYDAWDPTDPSQPRLEELLAGAGLMSKQSLYHWMKRNGIPLKNGPVQAKVVHAEVGSGEAVTALVGLLTDCTMRVRSLEDYIKANGLPLP